MKKLIAVCPRCNSSEHLEYIQNEYGNDNGWDIYIEWYRCTDCRIEVEFEYRLVKVTGELCGSTQ